MHLKSVCNNENKLTFKKKNINPVKANREILKVNCYFHGNLHAKRTHKKTLLSPIHLFSSPPVPSFKASICKTIQTDKIQTLAPKVQPDNPFTDFIQSISIPVSSDQFSSEVVKVSNENSLFKTLSLKKPIDWEFFPGQYLEVKAEGSSNKPTFLAVASGVNEHYIEITAKPNSNPEHANFCLNSLPGDFLSIKGPLGTYFPVEKINADTPVLILGGGSGLTTLKSLMESIPPQFDKKMIYSCKKADDLLYKNEIEHWKNEGHIISLTQSEDENFDHGRITNHLERANLNPNTLVFICGPKELVIDTAQFLAKKGIPLTSIYGSLPVLAKDGGPVFRGDHPKMQPV